MRICFFASEKPRERLMADAFLRGLAAHGDEGVIRALDGTAQVATDCEVAVMIGVKSRELWEANWRAGVHVIMLDKGYVRRQRRGPVRLWEYWRVAVDAHHPTGWIERVKCPHDRLERLGLEMQPWRLEGRCVLFAGSSEKYHAFYGLPHPTDYARDITKRIRKAGWQVVYRPKPSWRAAVTIPGTTWSGPDDDLRDVLRKAWAVVTHGSNISFEAMLAGVPSIVLGEGVARPVSSQRLSDLGRPYLADDEERWQWLANLAYCQWTMAEFASGEAWATIRPQIYG